MSARNTISGRCLCGAVRYEAGLPLSAATYCHCESCRRAHGAPAVAWVNVASASLRYTTGEPVSYESSPNVRRSFCGRCGSPLTYWCDTRSAEIDIAVGTLDDPGALAPADHIWLEDAPGWDRPADGLPAYARSRPAS